MRATRISSLQTRSYQTSCIKLLEVVPFVHQITSACISFLEKRFNPFCSDRKCIMTPGKLKINDLLHFKKTLYLDWVIWTQIVASFKLQVKKEKYLRQNSSGLISESGNPCCNCSLPGKTHFPPCSHPDHIQVFEEVLLSSSEKHSGL